MSLKVSRNARFFHSSRAFAAASGSSKRSIGLQFPGQGFQRVGALAGRLASHPDSIRPLLEEIDAALPKLRLSTALTDPNFAASVTPTSIAQPLILATSIALFRSWDPPAPIKCVMGHSLGEFSALTAAGCLSYRDALRLVHERGIAMQEAAPTGTGMTLVVKPRKGAEQWSTQLDEIAYTHNVDFANFNSQSQTALSGQLTDLRNAVEQLKKWHSRLIAKPLDVSAAFHSRYMEPAVPRLEKLVAEVDLHEPQFTVISNKTAKPFESVDEIRESIPQMLLLPVLWWQSAQTMAAEVDEIWSIGPGKVGKLTASEYEVPTEYLE